jgi:hypothetical protein
VNLLKSKLQRTAAVLGGALLGLGGVAAIAAPASAHAPSASGSTDCIKDSKWTVDWSVGNDYDENAKLVSAEVWAKSGRGNDWKKLPATALTGAVVDTGTVFKPLSKWHADDQVHGTTVVADDKITAVKISVVLVWEDGYSNDGKNGNGGPEVSRPVNKPEKCTTPVPPGNPDTPGNPPTDDSSTPSDTPSTPDKPELPNPIPPGSEEPADFTPIVAFDCDTMSVGMDNPANGITWTMKFKTSKGETRTTVVKPGEKKSEKFSATEGFSVRLTLEVTYEGKTYSDFVDIDYVSPGDCSGGGGGLPVTGAAAGGIAGGAGVLLAVGAGLFVMSRRRKVRFSA